MKKRFTFLLSALFALTLITQSFSAMGQTFKLISSNILSDGDEIIFVNSSENLTCSTTQNTNNRGTVSISTSNHAYTKTNSDNVQVFTVKTNTVKINNNDVTVYGFHTGSGYIYSASSSSNYLKTNSTAASTAPTGTSAWTISVSNSVFQLKNVSNTSYYLKFNESNNPKLFSQYTTSGSVKIYERAYAVTYNSGGGSGTMTDSNSPYASGETVTLKDNTFTKEGFSFSGWSVKDASNNDVEVTDGHFTMPRGVVTVTAQWTPATTDPYFEADDVEIAATATGGTIEYTVNNPVSGGKVSAACTEGDAWISEVAVTDEDDDENTVTFTTSTNATGEREGTIRLTYTYNTNETKIIDVTITQLTATYTVTYYANHGSADPIVAGPYNYGTAVNAATNTFAAPSGQTFECWNTQTDGNGTSYAAGEEITNSISNDKVLYAKWRTLNTYSLVTSADNIVPGKQYIIVSSNTANSTTTYYAMGKDRGTNRLGVPVTMNGDSKIVEADGVYEFFISGDADNYWTIYDINTLGLNASDSYGYLKALGGTSSNQLLTSTTLNNQGQWIITIASNIATIVANISGNTQRKYMRFNYNNGSPIFSCYETGKQADVYLYVKDNNNTDGTIYSTTTLSKNVSYNNLTIVKTVVNETPVINGSVTVPNNKTLTVTGTLNNQGSAANLVIEDGGQLIASNSVAATVKKSISAATITPSVTNWYAISSSAHDSDYAYESISNVSNLTSGTYDMFYYKESTGYWMNQKNVGGADGYDTLQMGRGYIYRNAAEKTLSFTGVTQSGSVKYPLTYTTARENIKGFHLIGNPYTHDIYKGENAAIPNTYLEDNFYTLTSAGGWEVATDNSTVIKPNMAVLVQATSEADGKNLVITKTTNQGPTKAGNDMITFMVKNSEYNDATYVFFKQGRGLNKIEHKNPEIPMLYINHNDESFAVVDMDDNTRSFNLNFKAMTMGKYTLSYKAKGNFSYLHVIDRLTGEDVDMLLEGEYSFIAAPGDNENRFIVVLEYLEALETLDGTFAYQNGNDIIVNGEGNLQIFDVMGRLIATQRVNGVETVNVSMTGVYVFKLNEKTQKIVVR